MVRRTLSVEEIREAISTEREVRCILWAWSRPYQGKVLAEVRGVRAFPKEHSPTFVFEGVDPTREEVGGRFEVLAGQLFVEDEE